MFLPGAASPLHSLVHQPLTMPGKVAKQAESKNQRRRALKKAKKQEVCCIVSLPVLRN